MGCPTRPKRNGVWRTRIELFVAGLDTLGIDQAALIDKTAIRLSS